MAKLWKYIGLLFIVVLALGTALFAFGHNVQADTPSDNITGPMAQTGPEPVSQQNGCNNTNDGGMTQNTGVSTTVEVDCWHSGWCKVCDEYADYSCNPSTYCWISSCPFIDPVPGIVNKIDAEVRGVPCGGGNPESAFINVYINDTLVGGGLMTGSCDCGGCYPVNVSSATYLYGFPGYVYGGENVLSLDIDGSSCISNVYVTLYYQPSTSPSSPKVSPSLSRPFNPPQMSVQYLSINPNQTAAGQPVTITTNVVNTGDAAGSLNVALKINGQVEETRMISVGPMATQPVKFTVSKSQPGTYAVDILGQEGSFTIRGAGAGTGTKINSTLLALLAMGILATIVAVLIIRSYRRTAN